MSEHGPRADGSGPRERVDAEYYDRSDYFEEASEHLQDLDSPFQRYRLRKVLEIYRPGPEERVLDLGCGWGTFTLQLAPEVREVVGVDFSAKSVALCRNRSEARGLENVRFVQADASRTGLPPDSFDVVVAADFFEHLYPDQTGAVLDECRRVLAPGGKLVIWTPNRGHFLEILKNHDILLRHDPSHVDYKSMVRLRRLLEERGFRIERAYYAESHLPVLRVLERSLLSFVPLLRRRIAILARKG